MTTGAQLAVGHRLTDFNQILSRFPFNWWKTLKSPDRTAPTFTVIDRPSTRWCCQYGRKVDELPSHASVALQGGTWFFRRKLDKVKRKILHARTECGEL